MNPLQSIIVPHEIVNDEFVTIVQCHFKNADKVKEGDAVITIETSKMTESLYAAVDGYVYYLCSEGNEMKIGQAIVEIYAQPLVGQTVFSQARVKTEETSLPTGQVVFSQPALRLIEELKIDKNLFQGRNFVGTEEVRLIHRQLSSNPPPVENTMDIEFQKISLIKKREIEYLQDVQSSGLDNVVSTFIDTTFLREELKQSKFLKHSLLPIVLSKLPGLLKEYREFNAFYKEGTIGFYKNIAIGFAVNLGDGLRVLKLPDTHEKNINEIEMRIFDTTKRYIDKKLTSKDMQGITFTVTDLSKEGVHFFVPMIPKGQCAILGLCAIDEKLQRSNISISFDHRVTDGKKAGEFLQKLKKKIEARR